MKKDTGSQCKVEVCNAIRCMHNEGKRCKLDSVTILPDSKCNDYESTKYTDKWQSNLNRY